MSEASFLSTGEPRLYFCCDERRRDAVRGSALNGIDFLEVVDRDSPAPEDRQRFIRVSLLNDLAPGTLSAANIHIAGGERIRPIVVVGANPGAADEANVLIVEVADPGDFSLYRLSLVRGAHDPAVPEGIDPRLASVEFSFKVECPADFDCAPRRQCPPLRRPGPEIDYLAKDYGSFCKLILDRMALIMPGWTERHEADLGITLVELLACVGDHLSYQQDAVSTEAYLDTARRRISLRRHARLVDYHVHDGTNARTWVHLTTESANVVMPAGTPILSRLEGQPVKVEHLDESLRLRPVVFETLHEVVLFPEHNAMPFYTWGERACCLPLDAVRATLAGHFPHLTPGSVLIFEANRLLRTGETKDADRSQRCALRLAAVRAFDEQNLPLADPLTGTEVTEIEWMEDDALPMAFPLSGFSDVDHGSKYWDDLAMACGNIVLTDHGLSVSGEALRIVPESSIPLPADAEAGRCQPAKRRFAPPRYRPALETRQLTQSSPYDAALPASQCLVRSASGALPSLQLRLAANGNEVWRPQRDLLSSTPDAREFVVEVEADGTPFLRFGDDEYGKRPAPGVSFSADYREGNGTAGNIGAETLAHIVGADLSVTRVRNPLPAAGGRDPETAAEIRRDAPEAFRTQERAVTELDYASVAKRDPSVQQAAATFRWTGSWHTVFVTVDRFGGLAFHPESKEAALRAMEPFRMAGHDLELDSARYVSLEIAMFVCVKPGYFRGHVRAALAEIFHSGTLADGRRGLFHPDAFTFGQPVHLSPLYAAAQAIPGVVSVEVTTFQRQDRPETSGISCGFLAMGRLEIARLANDPNFPEHGLFSVELGGGR